MADKNETVDSKGIIRIPMSEFEAVDISDKNIEKMARGYIIGNQAIGKRNEVKKLLENKVVRRIGKKGKLLTDKLFELVEGIYVVSSVDGEKMKFYKQPPNLNAIIYCLDRVLGKPQTGKPQDEANKGIAIVESIIKDLAGGTIEHKKSIEIKQ